MCTIFSLPVLAVCAMTSAPCDHVKGAGEVVKKTITLESFHGIQLEGAIDVILTPGATQAVEVEAQANLVDLVTTEVRSGVWTIGTGDHGYSTDKPFVVYITAPSIDQVTIQGSGDVKATGQFSAEDVTLSIEGSGDLSWDVAAKSVQASIRGSGDIRLSGSCEKLKASVEGSGDINAKGMTATTASASTTGSGDINVNTSGELSARIEGSGDIVYQGNPASVHSNVSGSGEVRHAGSAQGPR